MGMTTGSAREIRTDAATLARTAERARHLARPAFDGAVRATFGRLREMGTELEEDGDRLVAMAHFYEAPHGGSLRTFHGRQDHENGWWPAFKRRRNQHWQGQGMAQHDALVMLEADRSKLWAQSEAGRLEFHYKGRWRKHTMDLLVQPESGPPEPWEVKRDLDDLADEDYRDTLAGACEIWRRCGRVMRIHLAGETFRNRNHRRNATLVADRRFARVGPEHLGRLARLAMRSGPETTWGALAEALEPDFPPGGMAVAQALVVRRRLAVDLGERLDEDAPVAILTRSREGGR